MNKMKKVILSIGTFLVGMISKVYAFGANAVDPAYGVPRAIQPIENSILKIGKITVLVILFVIGLFVVLSKKLTKKVKIIVVSTLAILAILSVFLMNYFSTII